MYTIEDLKQLMARLRNPAGGCPWDLEQTYQSIAPSTLEEAYEVVDAIEREDLKHLPEELGDLLFQVIFYSQLGAEQNTFTFDEIVDGLVTKLLRRHPHVFPTGSLSDDIGQPSESGVQHVVASWEALKQQERQSKGQKSLLDDVPKNLPALSRAQKLQKRVAKSGWDWRDLPPMIEKLEEEKNELIQALKKESLSGLEQGGSPEVAEELGDLIFMAVNIARFLDLDSEACLRASSRKFERRVKFIERTLTQQSKTVSEQDDAALESLWQLAKSYERSGQL